MATPVSNSIILGWTKKTKEYNDKLAALNEGTAARFAEYLAEKRDTEHGSKIGWNAVRELPDTKANAETLGWLRLYEAFNKARSRASAPQEKRKATPRQKWNNCTAAFNKLSDNQKEEFVKEVQSWLN